MGIAESDKALRYISQLDDARCAGRWQDVPELCRKIEKHAPHRRCLTLTARSEAQIAAHSTQRPSTASSTASSALAKLIPSLQSAQEEESDWVQDAFQATVCLGWLHYVLEEPGLAIASLPGDLKTVFSQLQETSASSWTRVCMVKGAFLKGSSQEKTGLTENAIQSYRSVLSLLSSTQPTAGTPQFKLWTEHLLVRLCHLSDQTADTREYIGPSEALQAFRLWATYWDNTAKTHSTEGANAARQRRFAWKAYYDTLSDILRRGLPYEPEPTISNEYSEKSSGHTNTRLRQRAELKKVETIYESLLLKETEFPKASDTNHEIVSWADSVMDNWRFLCGAAWSNADLGAGGKEAVGRGVLDILYRAATKTFHSTQLLRNLFTVHASLADFDLAFKAYDAYVEIITRGKDRAEKTGEEDVAVDDDNTVLMISAEAIRLLCRYGSMKEAEKAVQIGHQIEKWLEQSEHIVSSTSEAGSARSTKIPVEPRALAMAYAAIGISQAQWARFTYEADARAGIQAKAELYLRRSLDPNLKESNNIEVLYALALVLAEKREIQAAIKVVKHTLSDETKQKTSETIDGAILVGQAVDFGRERKLIPVWHLLALLLSAREGDFGAAQKSCEAAFEQFGDPSVLFGKDDDSSYRSEHLKDIDGNNHTNSGIIDQMESFEKIGVLQVKMTQLSLLEEIDGVSTAVDGCDELLALHARLFGDTSAETVVPPPAETLMPPKTAGGGIRNSIFRGRGSVRGAPNANQAGSSTAGNSRSSIVAPQPTAAPAIQITDEDSNNHHLHLLHHHKNSDSQSGVQRSPSKLRKRSANSLRKKSPVDSEPAPEVPQLPEGISNGTAAQNSGVAQDHARQRSASGSVHRSLDNSDRPLRSIPHNMSPNSQPPPSGYTQHPLKQDTRLPMPFWNAEHILSDPYFSRIQSRRQKITLLVSIWIFISGLYSRAGMLGEAQDATKEAFKLVETFESEVAQESSTSKAFAEQGWGGGKSVEELWGDVYAARGQLLLSQESKHEARVEFERAVLHFPSHAGAIVGLSDILLDMYCEMIPLDSSKIARQTNKSGAEDQLSPPVLSRLAARDRAYGLLSSLTKLSTGWDYSEAWYALARAYEESEEMEKAKKALWWVVELEDAHPIRDWDNVTLGGFAM
ncbi:unnamed protein product [Periconia digitata]|uniref:Filamentation protein n=1 Tax=Periconia digitata TaxID=1303443 RepID=A0A9W4UEL3_9PLEO|nr:unnamed protein product [Periconia digitata]